MDTITMHGMNVRVGTWALDDDDDVRVCVATTTPTTPTTTTTTWLLVDVFADDHDRIDAEYRDAVNALRTTLSHPNSLGGHVVALYTRGISRCVEGWRLRAYVQRPDGTYAKYWDDAYHDADGQWVHCWRNAGNAVNNPRLPDDAELWYGCMDVWVTDACNTNGG